MLTVIDEFTRECLAIRVERRLNSQKVLEVLGELMVEHGVPEPIRSENGGEFRAKAVQEWHSIIGAKTLCIEPGSPSGRTDTMNHSMADCRTNA